MLSRLSRVYFQRVPRTLRHSLPEHILAQQKACDKHFKNAVGDKYRDGRSLRRFITYLGALESFSHWAKVRVWHKHSEVTGGIFRLGRYLNEVTQVEREREKKGVNQVQLRKEIGTQDLKIQDAATSKELHTNFEVSTIK